MILLINPANTIITLSLLDKQGKVFGRKKWLSKSNLSEHLVPQIDSLLKKNKLGPKDLSSIICITGPGSYTNLRITLSVINMFAYVLKVPIYDLSLTDLEAFSFYENFDFITNKSYLLKITLVSPYSNNTQSYRISKKSVNIFFNKIKTSRISVVYEFPANYSNGYIETNAPLKMIREKTPTANSALESLARDILVNKKIMISNFTSKEILQPIYYSPPIITKRKKKIVKI